MLCTLFCDVIVIMKSLMTKYNVKVSHSQGLVCIDYSGDPVILQLRMKKMCIFCIYARILCILIIQNAMKILTINLKCIVEVSKIVVKVSFYYRVYKMICARTNC